MKTNQPITDHLTDDLQFLIACCQTDLSDDDADFICSFIQHSTFNIQHSLARANAHGVLPLVYKTIKKIIQDDSSLVPDGHGGTAPTEKFLNAERYTCPNRVTNALGVLHAEILTELKAHYMSISRRNMLMSAELLRIMRLLERNHIQALAFKGPVLSRMAYGDITLRQYSDLDILVDESDAYRAGKLMSENGHTCILPLDILSNQTCLHTAKDFSLMSEPGGVHTELHWRLFEKKYNISILSCTVENKCQTVKINGKEIRTLQNELLLVYLCLHGAKHAFERIEWICDIDRLLRSVKIDWEEAIAIADQSHSRRSFYLGLSLVHYLFHITLPPELMQQIDTEEIRILQAMTLKQMSEKKNERRDFEKNRETFFYQAKLFDKKSDMVRFYLSTFFKISTNDCQMFVLPENLKFLYIVLRPIRLASSYIRRLFVKREA